MLLLLLLDFLKLGLVLQATSLFQEVWCCSESRAAGGVICERKGVAV